MKKAIFAVCFVLLAVPVLAALGDRHVEQEAFPCKLQKDGSSANSPA